LKKSNYNETYTSKLDLAKKSTDVKEKSELIKAALDAKSGFEFQDGLSQNLFNMIKELMVNPLEEKLSKLVAPDMQNINSLAGYGLNINKVDDA
jgi:hypothetical protein